MTDRPLGDVSIGALATELLVRCTSMEDQIRTERAHAEHWQKLVGHYDDIRGWLRLCTDDEAGHAEFYRECCLLIFGHYRNQSLTANGELITAQEEDSTE
jgi:hypothetical protein